MALFHQQLLLVQEQHRLYFSIKKKTNIKEKLELNNLLDIDYKRLNQSPSSIKQYQ
jgi:hypothetical protein